MKSFLVKLVWRFCSGWFVPNSEELYIAAVNLTMNDGERLYVLWSLVYCWDHNIQSCLSESVSESYSSLSEYRRLGFFPTLADLQPSVSWVWTWRTAQTRLGDVSLNQLRTHPWSGGGAGAVFVVFSHPQSLLSSYCVPPESTHRHCLEIRSSVGRDIRCSLGDFLNLKISFNSSSRQSGAVIWLMSR